MSFKSVASERFWQLYAELPEEIQELADKQYELFEQNPFHPSLQLKQVGETWTARVGLYYRVISCDRLSRGQSLSVGLDRFA
jgi:hypothetical protein